MSSVGFGSDQSKSLTNFKIFEISDQNNPALGGSLNRLIFSTKFTVTKSGDIPPWHAKIYSFIMHAKGNLLNESMNIS